jgi:hypothetical protein
MGIKWNYTVKVKSKNNKILGDIVSYLDMLKEDKVIEDFIFVIHKEKEEKK